MYYNLHFLTSCYIDNTKNALYILIINFNFHINAGPAANLRQCPVSPVILLWGVEIVCLYKHNN